MLRRNLLALRASLLVADGVAAVALFVVVSIARFGDEWPMAWAAAGAPWWVFALGYGLLWALAEWLQELDQPRVRWRLRSEAQDVIRAVALVAVSIFSLLFLLHAPGVSRQFLVWLFAAQIAFSLIQRLLLRRLLDMMRARGVGIRRVLIAGTGDRALAFRDLLDGHPELGFSIVGHIGPPTGRRIAVLGTYDDIEGVLHGHVVDEVAACPEPDALGFLEVITALCRQEGKLLRVPLPVGFPAVLAGRVERLEDVEILTIADSPDRVLGLATKRFVDLVVAAVALLALSPILLVIAIAIRAFEGGPVLFRQQRVGLNGRPFTMLKFRTMVPDAEDRLASLVQLNEVSGHAFKLQADPRITRIGAFLRRTSIDELPQLWNVVRGQMSIVGPRPPLPGEVAAYDLWHRRRLSMKPGITGLWQVSARLNQDFDRWVELDLSYIDRWSIWLDVKIMLRTLPAMLSGR